jgi:uncharacterized protein (TIGR03083 family)
MQLTPQYGTIPIITFDGPPDAVLEPALRQYRRLVGILETLDAEQWAHPSRCEGWSTKDVIAHLESATAFFGYSIACGVKGEPTELLATFDPVASPPQLIAGTRAQPPQEVLERFATTVETFTTALTSLDADGWLARAEAPPGHLAVGAVVQHGLWDSWVHERDILLPLGLEPVEEADEIRACLRYVSALGPAFALTRNPEATGVLGIDVSDPDVSFVVRADRHAAVLDATGGADLTLTGDAVDLLESLSIRRPLGQEVPEDASWLVAGLAETFDRAPG